MDKYQEFLIKSSSSFYGLVINGRPSTRHQMDDTIVLTQNEDITISDYILCIVNHSISSISAVKGTLQKEFSEESPGVAGRSEGKFFISIDFEDRLDGIKISFKNGLADDLYLPLVYNLADKEKYYAKKEQERKDNLFKTANIKVSTGVGLVNIYFKPCSENYAGTEIVLYRENMMIAKYKVEEETFFKSITGLANGKYEFVLKQFDKDNNIILETDKIRFFLENIDYSDIGF